MKRLLIVDGMNLTFQMFFGMPAPIIGRHGRPIQGTVGFLGALIRVIRRISPTHIAVIFDGRHHNPRTDLDPEYKANRPDWSEVPEEELPFSQLPDVYAALDYLGIAHAETTVCECDDVIAAYVKSYSDQCDTVIMSQDSDYFQLVCDSVRVLRYRGDNSVLCDTDYVRSRYGVSPSQYADFKSLVGDSSDNVRGAQGVGPKTAAALLGEYGSLDGILASAESIGRAAIRASITESADRLRRNMSLIRLDGLADLPFSLAELCYEYRGESSGEVLRAIGL